MVESRVATLQGDNIGKLTRVTVVSQFSASANELSNHNSYMKVFLPLSLGTVRILQCLNVLTPMLRLRRRFLA